MKILFVILLILSLSNSLACTSFLLPSEENPVMAKSYDFDKGEGAIYINYKNMKKKSLFPNPFSMTPVEWTSKYGSVSFSQAGIEFPFSILNEKGLAIEVQILYATEYESISKHHKYLNESQVVQYLADTSSNINEAIENIKNISIYMEKEKLHYFMCDANSECAMIEILNGKLEIIKGEDLPLKQMTNSTYKNSLASVGKFLADPRSITGVEDDKATARSLTRFNTIHNYISSLSNQDNMVEKAFKGLDKVEMSVANTLENSQWQIVHELRNKKINFKTKKQKILKSIDLNKINFECNSTQYYLDLDDSVKGELSEKFKKLTITASYNTVSKSIDSNFLQKIMVIAAPRLFMSCL